MTTSHLCERTAEYIQKLKQFQMEDQDWSQLEQHRQSCKNCQFMLDRWRQESQKDEEEFLKGDFVKALREYYDSEGKIP